MTAKILEFKRPPTQEEIEQRIKEVKASLSVQERLDRVKASVDRINQLIAELKGK